MECIFNLWHAMYLTKYDFMDSFQGEYQEVRTISIRILKEMSLCKIFEIIKPSVFLNYALLYFRKRKPVESKENELAGKLLLVRT